MSLFLCGGSHPACVSHSGWLGLVYCSGSSAMKQHVSTTPGLLQQWHALWVMVVRYVGLCLPRGACQGCLVRGMVPKMPDGLCSALG